ncbi:MAG: 3-deoxy-D-manno-octulosonic-acid transferase [Motiliproteus sp.]|jgi:3-deoxy-D-manno-octulosonic-acid transferase
MDYRLRPLFEESKWLLFSALNRLADLKGGKCECLIIHYPESFQKNGDIIWVFCSTIGEVNACKPFLSEAAKRGQLVLMTDRNCYRDSYWRHFPDAVVVELSGRIDDGQQLAAALKPHRFIVCEIPALPVEAPCRLSYGVVRAARLAGAECYLVNGWLYHYRASCRMDAMEDWFFGSDFLHSFTFVTAQTDEVMQYLQTRGLDASKIEVCGNMKFDAVSDLAESLLDDRSRNGIDRLQQAGRKIMVAGCLTDVWEYQLLLEAFTLAYQQQPELFLVLAPRHPEYPEQMKGLSQLLDKSGLEHRFKSTLVDEDTIETCAVLVLDTFGELKSFYSRCDLSYVGVNHNVLEPLSFGRRVLVSEGWEKTYPSYPVYQMTRELQLIEEVSTAGALAQAMLDQRRGDVAHLRDVRNKLQLLEGAVERNLKHVFG